MNFSNKYCMCVHFWPFLFWEDFETTQTRWAVKFQNFFGGATWSKFAPGTCESCPSWCWKGNWRGAANFLRPDVQMDGLFLRFEEGKKKGLEEKHSLIFCPEVFFVAWLIDKKSTRITGNISPRWRTDLPAGMRHQEHKEAQKHYFNLKLQNIACILYKGNPKHSQFWRSCWRLREVSKLPLGPCVVGKPPPARWWHRTPQIIPRWSFIQRILASFALNFAMNRTDTDTPCFFLIWKTTQTTPRKKRKEHDEEKPK